MERLDINVQAFRPQLKELIRKFGPPGCELIIVDSVQEWAVGAGIREDDPFRAAMAATRRPDGIPTIVLLAYITADIQGSVIGALLYRGFGDEADRLQDPAAFLEHLVLHEIAHLVLKDPSESDCDQWAFERLAGQLTLPSTGAAYHALEAAGRSQVGKNCVASPASLFLCASTSLRQRRWRPQLKRDPLGSASLPTNIRGQRTTP